MSLPPHERLYERLGLLGDAWDPTYRAVVTFSLVSLAVFVVQPAWAFDEHGRMRPWSKTFNLYGVSTPVPWWLPGLGAAAVAGIL